MRHVALGEPKSVPAGLYAAQTLKFMRLLEVLKPKIVYGMDVRQVLTYVESAATPTPGSFINPTRNRPIRSAVSLSLLRNRMNRLFIVRPS